MSTITDLMRSILFVALGTLPGGKVLIMRGPHCSRASMVATPGVSFNGRIYFGEAFAGQAPPHTYLWSSAGTVAGTGPAFSAVAGSSTLGLAVLRLRARSDGTPYIVWGNRFR